LRETKNTYDVSVFPKDLLFNPNQIFNILKKEMEKINENMRYLHTITPINNNIYELPTVIIKKMAPDINNSIDEKIRWIESLVYEDFELSNYKSHESLSAIMK
jgi:hypothetical protein